MLRPSKVVRTEIISALCLYNDLKIDKCKSGKNKYDIFKCNHLENTYKYLITLSVEELRYVAEYNSAIIVAVKNYYNSQECSVKEISKIGIPTEIKVDELKTSIQIAMEQALADTTDINELLDIYEDIIEMAQSTLNIFRMRYKIKNKRS